MITEKKITDAVVELIRKAETNLPKDVELALRRAYLSEKNKIARIQLRNILDNIRYARKNAIPICQDTGLINFYVKIGSKADVDLEIINKSIRNAVKIATNEIPLRPNTVHPLTRKNTGNNTGISILAIETEILPEKEYIEITALVKGAGSDNMSRLTMLNPSEGINGTRKISKGNFCAQSESSTLIRVKKFIIDTVANAGGRPCPPTVVCVGIGGSSDIAAKLAKKALLRKIGLRSWDRKIAKLEDELLKKINKLGIGPMGLGGRTTALDVHIEIAHCHTGSLPVAVNLGCWANRHKTVRIY